MAQRRPSRKPAAGSRVSSLAPYFPVADAVATLFAPYAEVAVHDLATDKIAHVANPMSRRRVGDPSQLDDISIEDGVTVVGPYEKINWDGRRLKCISAVLPGAEGPVGLMCINVDVSQFDEVRRALDGFLTIAAPKSDVQSLFLNDWREHVNAVIGEWTRENGVTVDALKRDQRGALIAFLNARGAFNARNAHVYVARLLGVSRATLYSELARVKSKRPR